ncbi:MAG: hypothetical protein MRY83_04155 [Flavobacteriales bacterium]|nr:hypothetical protein [Flavobacteriales bacterium]
MRIRTYLIGLYGGADRKAKTYSEIIEWLYNNQETKYVLTLSESDVYHLEYETELLDIINDENESMLQMGEDTWIHSEHIKTKILERIQVSENKEDKLVRSIVTLLLLSLETDENLYFLF